MSMSNLLVPVHSATRSRSNSLCHAVALALSCLMVLGVLAQSPPNITRHPTGGSRSLGDRHTFRVFATSQTPVEYQWRHNGISLPGATNVALNLTNLTALQSGAYSVRIANESGSVVSEPGILEVDAAFQLIADSAISKTGFSQGASWADYDDDGFVDLFVAGRNQDMLFRNKGDGTFTQITTTVVSSAHGDWATIGGVWGDYDNNGLLDLFIVRGWGGENSILHQQTSSGRFVIRSARSIFPDGAANAFSATWGDYDRDGHLDLFAGGFWSDGSDFSTPVKPHLYRNAGTGSFVRISDGPFADAPQRIEGSAWSDFNNDGRPDLLVARFFNQSLWMLQEASGGFTLDEVLAPALGGFRGLAIGDFDNDSDFDVFFCSQNGVNPLLRNDGDNNFSRLFAGDLGENDGGGFGASWGDYDNDGWLDLFVARTSEWNRHDSSGENLLYHNNGDGTFTRVTSGSMVNGTDSAYTGIWADYNNDGFLDLMIANTSDRGGNLNNALFRNSGNANSWLLLKLVGTKSNRAAIGAKVQLKATIKGRGVKQLREVSGGHGMASQNDLRVHFGLGDAAQADEVRIEWPSGQITELRNVPAKQIMTITEPGGPPRLAATKAGGLIQFTLLGDAGTTYVIEASEDLKSWSRITEVTSGMEPVGFATGDALGGARFYRAKVR